jgi:hypothetical protein
MTRATDMSVDGLANHELIVVMPGLDPGIHVHPPNGCFPSI